MSQSETKLAVYCPSESDLDLLARRVADTLVARRNVEMRIVSYKLKRMSCAEKTPYWSELMTQERDARIANDGALAAYRSALKTKGGGR